MTFESRVAAFSTRFLSGRSFELIVEPALADLEFDTDARNRLRNRIGVLRALAGALRVEVSRQAAMFMLLTLVPACYYFALISICFDFFSGPAPTRFIKVAAPLLLFSVTPVIVCFWPERHKRVS